MPSAARTRALHRPCQEHRPSLIRTTITTAAARGTELFGLGSGAGTAFFCSGSPIGLARNGCGTAVLGEGRVVAVGDTAGPSCPREVQDPTDRGFCSSWASGPDTSLERCGCATLPLDSGRAFSYSAGPGPIPVPVPIPASASLPSAITFYEIRGFMRVFPCATADRTSSTGEEIPEPG